ncbi:putative Rab-GAP TBC domain-containing protein [Seiridium unicorne]|uniref:Rab-GAP TBC domain-containing protein n=1 Tax=Seiridium unicorne TaxID=138068 RepID=A0ABR2VEQ3_9PEZI
MSTNAGQPAERHQSAGAHEDEAAMNHAKSLVILDACNRGDIDDLKKLAVSKGGFLSDIIRCQAWSVLLGNVPSTGTTNINEEKPVLGSSEKIAQKSLASEDDADLLNGPWTELPRHRDEDQVRLDVDRSFIYYPNDQSQSQLDIKKTELSDLITETLRRQPFLCYFQGYHDICQVFLLVLPPALRTTAVARLSTLRIRDFMLPNLTPAISQLRLIPDIINSVDPALCRHLSQTEPFFALSGTLTMYAHDIQSYSSIARLFDALLAREQIFSVYLFAQIVLNRREELFDTPDTEPEMLHSILSKLPQPLDLDKLIADTATLFEKHPPESLRSWRGISNSSVLKTARDVKACARQTLDEGHSFFNKQLRELQWAESRQKMLKTMWAYRRPARGVALAVLIGVAAVYLRKSPSAWGFLAAFWSRFT